jgi:hypothetical protein
MWQISPRSADPATGAVLPDGSQFAGTAMVVIVARLSALRLAKCIK